ncbi:MAG TPA: DNA-3-methyladenine glycosylase [Cyclobacteriaceae bacterium]|jgi:DNA-3-methyladenine glycosylase II|nr:DNA-3-methyladenine glycosylase [Cyclobacteriaceae bacterium]
MQRVSLTVPQEFSFALNLEFLQRSPKEILHRVSDTYVTKLLKVDDELVLFRVSFNKSKLQLDFLKDTPSEKAVRVISDYVREWFDLETNLKPFYKMASEDKLLRDLATQFYGYRIVALPDLFESLVWAVMGQQINVQFAYTIKQRFVELYGSKVEFEEENYYLFPTAKQVSQLKPEELLPLQFSRQKALYTILIAQAFVAGSISKEKLIGKSLIEAKEELIKIKGVGNWTANYAMMKTFRYPDAFPLEDVAIHNAIKKLKKMKVKPTLDQVRRVFKKYKGWEAYATLYLWKSL